MGEIRTYCCTGKPPLYLQLSTEGGAVPQRNAAGALNVVHSFRWWNLKVDSGILTLTRSRPITEVGPRQGFHSAPAQIERLCLPQGLAGKDQEYGRFFLFRF